MNKTFTNVKKVLPLVLLESQAAKPKLTRSMLEMSVTCKHHCNPVFVRGLD